MARPVGRASAPEALDEDRAARLIAAQLPELRGLPVTREGAGMDHDVFAAGEEWLVRFPRHAERAAWCARELSIMAVVRDALGDRVPHIELVAARSAAHPNPIHAYRRIPGVAADRSPVVDRAGLARDLGRTLSALHTIDPGRIPRTPADWEGLTVEYERVKLLACGGAAAARLPPVLAARAEPYVTGVVPVPAREAPQRFIHNDICPDHVIVDPRTGRLRGVIDFTDAMAGDPVLDFVGLAPIGGLGFVRRVRAAYALPLGEGFTATLEWLARTLTLRWLAEADAEEVPKHVRWVELAFDHSTTDRG